MISCMKIKENGTWKDTDKVFFKENGIWKEVEQVFRKVGGVWVPSCELAVRFQMKITSPTEPGFKNVLGGSVTVTDNNDGTWDVLSTDAIAGIALDANKMDITEIEVVKSTDLTSCASMFDGAKGLTNIVFTDIDTTKVTDFSKMFSYCESIAVLDLSKILTPSALNIQYVFSRMTGLTTPLDVSGFDTSNVTRMGMKNNVNGTFQSYPLSSIVGLDQWDTSKVTDLGCIFKNSKVTSLDIGGWDVSKVTDFGAAFSGCTLLTSLNTSLWDTTSAEKFVSTFTNCTSLQTLDVSGFKMSNVLDLHAIFGYCTSLQTLDVSNWDVSSVINLTSAFNNCTSLQTLDVSGWNTFPSSTTQIEDMGATFTDSGITTIDLSLWICPNIKTIVSSSLGTFKATKVTDLDLSGFDFSRITDARGVFYICGFLVSIKGNLDFGNTIAVQNLFNGCEKLKCIESLTTPTTTDPLKKKDMFKTCTALTQPDLVEQALFSGLAGHTWTNSNACPAPAKVYDAYVIGGSLGSNITISPFMQSDGVTEEASMQGIDFLDGVERSLIIKYQAGVTDAHIDINAPFNLAVDFSSDYVVGTNIEPMFNLADSPFKGEWVIQVVASGVEVRVKYDSVKGKLYTDWS